MVLLDPQRPSANAHDLRPLAASLTQPAGAHVAIDMDQVADHEDARRLPLGASMPLAATRPAPSRPGLWARASAVASIPVDLLERATGTAEIIALDGLLVGSFVGWGIAARGSNFWNQVTNTALASWAFSQLFLTKYADTRNWDAIAATLHQLDALRRLDAPSKLDVPSVGSTAILPAPEATPAPATVRGCLLGVHRGFDNFMRPGIFALDRALASPFSFYAAVGLVVGLLASREHWGADDTWLFWVNTVPQYIATPLIDVLLYALNYHWAELEQLIARTLHLAHADRAQRAELADLRATVADLRAEVAGLRALAA